MQHLYRLGLAAVLGFFATAGAAAELGVDYVSDSVSRETTYTPGSSTTDNGSLSGYRVYGAFGAEKSPQVELFYESLTGDEEIASNSQVAFGLDFLVPFAVQERLIPHFKFGGAYGWRKLDYKVYRNGSLDDTWYNYSANVGLGLTYMLGDHLGIKAGGEYIYRVWETMTYRGTDIEPADTVTRLSAGLTYSF
ncbi:hypothetical protein [Thiohalorhabdus methylotrophus]|uniref:Outer membrane protein beta-barrel domain-containing protein n=1 Tax=Thiohalorhabdus methylotrophus TaxID=3242694 RepID=A0ABV4TPG6_9GAMM